MTFLLDHLNPTQREAVLDDSRALLILAGAGSGKTRVLTHKIAYLLREKNVSPADILGVTFTNKAAGEMKERVSGLLGYANAPSVWQYLWIGTFHAIGLKILKQHAAALGYNRDFAVYDSQDQLETIKDCMQALHKSRDKISPTSVASFINRHKCDFTNTEHLMTSPLNYYEKQLCEIYEAYERCLKQNHAMDFGDLLIKPLLLFSKNPSLLEHYRARLRYLFVDEYQDTNAVQYQFLKALMGPTQLLCVVGDEDQSIYRFRGADIHNILDFERDFPDAKIVRLEQNYRSTKAILHAANEVVRHNTNRLGKTLWSSADQGDPVVLYRAADDREEATFVVDEIRRLSTTLPLEQMAIFYRTNAQSRVFEEELRRYNVPYRIYGGLRFFERKEIKDIIAYLRLLVNPSDSISFKRVVNVPARGIGKTTLDKIDLIARERGLSAVETIRNHPEDALSGRARPLIENFFALCQRLHSYIGQLPLTDFVTLLLKETGYEAMLKDEDTREAQARLENIDEFLNAVAEYEKRSSEPTLAHFLDEISLETTRQGSGDARAPLPLMTLHLAKGLEFPAVFIVGLEENLLPHSRSQEHPDELEEERRLMYVGMTRAMQRLTLSYAYKRYAHGREQWNIPSRFIDELPQDGIIEKGTKCQSSALFYDDEDYSQDVM